MSAILPAPPSGVTMRPFLLVPPDAQSPDYGAISSHPLDAVICVGPFKYDKEAALGEYPSPLHVERYAQRMLEPRWFADGGTYLCREDQGRYVMLWRVAEGRPRKRGPGARVHWDYPPRKLAHWESLERGSAMMLCPEPDDDAIEAAVSRAARMRAQGRGRFQPFFDDAGALWVTRLPDAP